MTLTKGHWFLLAFTAAYIAGFGAYFSLQGNGEFLWYVAVMVGLVVFVGTTLKRSQFSLPILWALSLWGLLHMLGGGVRIDGHVLYAQVLIPLHIDGEMSLFKYDQFVHMYGFGIAAIGLLTIFRRWAGDRVGPRALAATAVLSAMGLGVINEMVEFAAVVASPNTGVGGYFNTALDLVFNTLGALVAVGAYYAYLRLKSLRTASLEVK